jgi:translation initiation factor RLI1
MTNLISRSRLVVATFAFGIAVTAQAAPKVGDSATLDGFLNTGNGKVKVTTAQSITEYNVNTDVYTVKQFQAIGNDTETTEVQAGPDEIMSEELAANIVEICESNGLGKKEKVKVAAGTFNTCRVSTDDGSVLWIAAVPFGIVKLTTAIPTGSISLGATSFSRGQ